VTGASAVVVPAAPHGPGYCHGVPLGECQALAGTSSWADRSLVREGTFYPSRSLSAAQRLAHYASRFPLAEVATTYRFPPTPEVAQRWAGATPPGFTIDVRAWSLLCGAPTWPESLWADLQGYVRPSQRDGAKLYRQRLPADVVDECWERFNHALRPLVEAGKLGAVIVRFPAWFSPRPAAFEELATLTTRLPGLRTAVELTNPRWYEGDACEQTLSVLDALGLCFVCRDTPGPGAPIVAATADVALVRLPGRAVRAVRGGPLAPAPVPTAPGEGLSWGPAYAYRYSDAELAAWAPAIRDLASGTSQVHIILDNCWRANAVDNAATLLSLLAH
jgi:uncharacterized protein YecE (DUF72 family)